MKCQILGNWNLDIDLLLGKDRLLSSSPGLRKPMLMGIGSNLSETLGAPPEIAFIIVVQDGVPSKEQFQEGFNGENGRNR